MLAFFFIPSVIPIHTRSIEYYNGCIPALIDTKISKHLSFVINNSQSNYIGILFHYFPGPFTLTSYTIDGEFKRTLIINNIESMSYFYLFKPTDESITISSEEEINVYFSLFSSEIGCINENEYFVTSKPNQTLVFKNNLEEKSIYKINSKSRKCILIDSGKQIQTQVSISSQSSITSYFNFHQNSSSKVEQTYKFPLFYTFVMDEIQAEDNIQISYQSSEGYDHIFQTGEPIQKEPDNKKAGIVRIDITVAIISGLFVVFIFMTIIGLRRMRRMADDNSEDEAQTVDPISVYEPESNEETERKIQYPKKFSSDEEYSLTEETENKVKEILSLPPKDVFHMIREKNDLLEESEQNETPDTSEVGDEDNPYDRDATLTL